VGNASEVRFIGKYCEGVLRLASGSSSQFPLQIPIDAEESPRKAGGFPLPGLQQKHDGMAPRLILRPADFEKSVWTLQGLRFGVEMSRRFWKI
jgi:hypothetical protein